MAARGGVSVAEGAGASVAVDIGTRSVSFAGGAVGRKRRAVLGVGVGSGVMVSRICSIVDVDCGASTVVASPPHAVRRTATIRHCVITLSI